MSPNLTDRFVHRTKAHPTPRLLRGHNGSLAFVAFLSDDQIISASDEDKTLRRWNVSDGHNKLMKELVVCAVATSPNGRWVAMGGSDGRVRLLDLKTPTKVTRSNGRHGEVIKSLSFSPDSSQLASGAQDGTMFVWSSATLEQVAGPFEGYRDSVWCVCYSPDGKKIASCDREVIRIWDSTTWVGMAIKEKAWSLAWSADGDTIFAGCIDGAIKRYNSNTGLLLATCSGHSDVVFSIVLSHNAKFFATASWDKTVRLWEAETFQQIDPILPHDAKIHSISISPDDSRLVSGARDSHIRVWDLRVIAPALFRTFPLEPNRSKNGHHRFQFPAWGNSPKDPGPSDASDHDGSHPPDSHDETDRSSTTSKSSKKNRILNPFRTHHEQGDTIDDPRAPGPSAQGRTRTDSPFTDRNSPMSDPSFHRPTEVPQPVLPLDVRQDTTINPPRSPVYLKSPLSASENGSFIREIRSDPTRDLTGSIMAEDSNPVTGGSHGDIYRGTLHVNGQAMRVAIKVIKKYTAQGDDQSKQRRLRREIKLWLTLDHKNVIPLLGTTKAYGDFPAMVCPWVENGSLTTYLDRRNNDLTAQLRFGIINDVALGLQYLHSRFIVHGDISGSNILIHGSGRACIADFGLSMVETEIEGSSIALTYQVKGTLRYTAPELFHIPENEDEDSCKIFPTSHSDIYSFGGIMLQVLTGKVPYHYLSRDEQVLLTISKGEHPRRPTSTSIITDDLWEFMMASWSFVPTDRPSDLDMVTFVHDQLLNAVVAS